MDLHVFPILIPPTTTHSTRYHMVFPVHQARALVSCIQPGLVIFNRVFLSQYLWASQMAQPGKESACHCRRLRKLGFSPWVRKFPWRRKWQPNAVFLPEKFHRQKSPVGHSLKDGKESDMTEHSTVSVIFRVEALVFVAVKDAKIHWMPFKCQAKC